MYRIPSTLVILIIIILTSLISITLHSTWLRHEASDQKRTLSTSRTEQKRDSKIKSVHFFKEQMYSDLKPYLKIISQMESRLPLNVTMPTEPVKYQMLNASSVKFLDQIKELDSIRTVIFAIPKSISLDVLSPICIPC